MLVTPDDFRIKASSFDLRQPENILRIIDMRRYQTLMESKFPTEVTRVFKGMETPGNPWGLGSNTRDAWAEGLDVPRAADGAHDLVPVAQLQEYRGFFFVHFQRHSESLADYLAGAKAFIDLVADQSDVGMEIVGGVAPPLERYVDIGYYERALKLVGGY